MKKIRQDITQSRLLPQMAIEELEAEAIEFLLEKCGQSSHVGLAFSGGKDSVVIMELMRRTGLEFTSIYNVTHIDPPEVVRFIRKHHPYVSFLYPRKKFFAQILINNPPMHSLRWCCRVLKHGKNESRKFQTLVLGVRAEESLARRDRERAAPFRLEPSQLHVYPILKWTLLDVWEYIEFRNLPYCSLYDEGWDRLGCVPCLYKSPHMHELSKERWPGIYHAFENSVKKWFYKRQTEGADMYNNTPEEFLADWYQHKARWYAGQKPKDKS